MQELTEAQAHIEGWNPDRWSVDIAARILVMCQLAEQRGEHFGETLTDLCRNADLAESIALYSGVSLYPNSDLVDQQIGEGLRTNMRSVFEAIAHQNPYPAEYFDENRWNHMVLKALFIDSTLAPIYGQTEIWLMTWNAQQKQKTIAKKALPCWHSVPVLIRARRKY